LAYDSPWYEPQHTQAAAALEIALANDSFTEEESGWASLLHLYLTADMIDGSLSESLPRTPAELEVWSAEAAD
jgi:hypothetical protein